MDVAGALAFGIRHILKVAPNEDVVVDVDDVQSFVAAAAAWRAGCRVVVRTDGCSSLAAAAPVLTCTRDADVAAAALAQGRKVLDLRDTAEAHDQTATTACLALVCAGCSIAERGDLWLESTSQGRRHVGDRGEALAALLQLAQGLGLESAKALEMVVGGAPNAPPTAAETEPSPHDDPLASAAKEATKIPGIASATRVFLPRVWRHAGPVHALVLVSQKGVRWSGRRVAELGDDADSVPGSGGRDDPSPRMTAAAAVADIAERAPSTHRYVRAAKTSRVGVLRSSPHNAAVPIEASQAVAALVDLADERELESAFLSARTMARTLPRPRGSPNATCIVVGLDPRSSRELGGPRAAASYFVDEWAASARL